MSDRDVESWGNVRRTAKEEGGEGERKKAKLTKLVTSEALPGRTSKEKIEKIVRLGSIHKREALVDLLGRALSCV